MQRARPCSSARFENVSRTLSSHRGHRAALFFSAPAAAVMAALAFGQFPPAAPAPVAPPDSPAATRPAIPATSKPAGGRRVFQPGVVIDWDARAVLVAAHVVLREGPLEFAACFSGKEHESILRIDAKADDVYMAIGLIGLTPGSPPRWIEEERRYAAPGGDLVDVGVVVSSPPERAEIGASVDLLQWVREVRYLQTPVERPWVFAGSRPAPDGSLIAGKTGAALAMVDFSESLLAMSRRHTSMDAALWAVADTERIPPEKTPVTLVFRAARARALRAELGPRGELRLDGRLVDPADFADVVNLQRQIQPGLTVEVRCDPAATAGDRRRAMEALQKAGVGDGVVRFAG
jgi:hypothetical protein